MSFTYFGFALNTLLFVHWGQYFILTNNGSSCFLCDAFIASETVEILAMFVVFFCVQARVLGKNKFSF